MADWLDSAGNVPANGFRPVPCMRLGVCALLLAASQTLGTIAWAQEPAAQSLTPRQMLGAFQEVLADVIERAEPSVVSIARVRRNPQEQLDAPFIPQSNEEVMSSTTLPPDFVPNEFGTGVVIDPSGLILTTTDVLGVKREDAEETSFFVVTHDRKSHAADIVGADPRLGIAVLKIRTNRTLELTPITFGDPSQMRKGHFVITLGNPYAIARDGQASASIGHVTNLGRKAGATPAPLGVGGMRNSLHQFGTLIQTDAKLNLGCSGGPMLNLDGEMVGLVCSFASLVGYEESGGFAIPIDGTFLEKLEAVKRGQEPEYSFLGVRLSNPTSFAGPLPQGAQVDDVLFGTPAHMSGLRRSDLVTHVNGQSVHDVDMLMLELGKLPVGADVRLTVKRSGDVETVTATLSKFRVQEDPIVTQPRPAWRGVRVDYPTAVLPSEMLAEPFAIRSYLQGLRDGCVAVRDVDTSSVAWEAGLRPGMLISQVGANYIDNPNEFYEAVAGDSGAIALLVWDGSREAKSIQVPADTLETSPRE